MLGENPLEAVCRWSEPSFVAPAGSGALVIDSSRTRVTALDASHRISAVIQGGRRGAEALYHADHAVWTQEGIWVADVQFALPGMRVESERVLLYAPDGRFVRAAFERRYPDGEMPLQYGNILYLGAGADGGARFLMRDGGDVLLYALDGDGARELRKVSAKAAGSIWRMAYDAGEDRIWIINKRAELYFEAEPGFERCELPEKIGILGDIAFDGQGGRYCADIGARTLGPLGGGALLSPGGELPDAPIYRRLAARDGAIGTTDGERVLLMDKAGGMLFDAEGAPYASGHVFRRSAVWLAAFLLSAGVLFALVRAAVKLFRRDRPTAIRVAALVSTVALTTAFVAAHTLGAMSARVADMELAEISRTTEALSRISGATFGEAFKAIDSLDDYGSEAYRAVRAQLDPYCDAAYDNGSSMYYILYKYEGDLLYGVLDYEDTQPVVYPFGTLESSGYDVPVREGGVLRVARESDSFGVWTYAVAPVLDKAGETVGALEMGVNLYAEQQKDRAILLEICASTAAMALVLLLLLSEGIVLLGCFPKSRAPGAHAPGFVRPLAFLLYFADSFAVAFKPQLAAELLRQSNLGLSESIGTALPISLEAALVVAAAPLGSVLYNRLGPRRAIALCAVLLSAGSLLSARSAASGCYLLLLSGQALCGVGLGTALVTLNVLPASLGDGAQRARNFASMNMGVISGVVVGVSIGAYIANWLGYAGSLAVAAVAALVIVPLSRAGIAAGAPRAAERASRGLRGALRFAAGWKVLSFFLLIMLPVQTALYFKELIFPLFAAEGGKSEVFIGNVLLLGGAAAIYLGSSVSSRLLERAGRRGAVCLGAGLLAAALLLFGFLPSLGTAVAAVMLINVAASFGLAGQGLYFAELRASAEYGVDRAMGVFSLMDGVSQALGPFALGALAFLGYGAASLAVGALALTALGAFAMLSRRKAR